jgi:hypothetical protein
MIDSSHARSNTWKAYTVDGLVCAMSAIPPKADIRQRMLERAVVDRFSSLGLRLDAGSDTRH